jgi:CDP-diacylglycerol--glycerol-3-phosphate 3-phosphatidyltransferase
VTAESGPSALPPGPAAVRLVNIANLLTVIRLLLVPVFVAFTLVSGLTDSGWRIAATLVFATASLTDFVDGWIARRFHMITNFGKVADPIADKVLTGSALIMLSGYGLLPWWATVLILVREVGVTVLRFWVIRHGVIAASRGGKLKTALQLLAISWYLWPLPADWAVVGEWLMAAAVVVTVITGVDYVVSATRLRRPPLVAAARRPEPPGPAADPEARTPVVPAAEPPES